MRNDEILEILVDWNFWKTDLDAGILRESMISELKQMMKTKEIVVVTGVRRSGKSTLLLQLLLSLLKNGAKKKDVLIVNFEDPRFRNLDLTLLNKIYDVYLTELSPSKQHYVVLDEVQNIDGWEKFARFLHENKKVQVFVTGSSSKLLSSEYATVLGGRHVDVDTYPLSFREFLFFKGIDGNSRLGVSKHRHAIQRAFKEYMEWGGFPKVVLTEGELEKRKLLDTHFRDIMIKDVVARYKIKNVQKLEDLAKYYFSNISTLQSFNNIKNVLRLNIDTVERYSSYLSSVYMLFFVKKFSFKEKEQLMNPRKLYGVDTGLRNVVAFRFMENIGRLAENIVYLHLKRKGEDIFYWKGKGEKEVDFVLKKGLIIRECIQVCWNIDERKTKEREIGGLVEALNEFALKEGLIITGEKAGEETVEGKKIQYIPLWKWLLQM